MKPTRRFAFALPCLLALGGCLSTNPRWELPADVAEACHDLPQQRRSHVFVFLVDDLPFCRHDGADLRAFLIDQGFIKTYAGYSYHALYFAHEAKRLRKECADNRIAIIGLGSGVGAADSLVGSLAREGSAVDLLIHVGGKPSEDQALGAGRFISIADDESRRAETNTPAPRFRVGGAVLSELAALARTVPVQVVTPPIPPDELAPTPRPVPPRKSARRDEWDFLKPLPANESRS